MTDLASVWQQTLDQVKESGRYDEATFAGWVSRSRLDHLENGQAFVVCPSMITQSVIRQEKETFETLLSTLLDEPLQLHLISEKEAAFFQPDKQMSRHLEKLEAPEFRQEYTFDTFVEGASNREAFAACWNSCNQYGPHSFNPIMLYGNSGLGKTHLLHAVGNYLKEARPDARVIYMYSHAFVDLLIDAMKSRGPRGNRVDEVKAQLVDCDYFLLDDIQNLKNSSSQEIFFAIYNELIAKNTQIILTSDIHPQELQGLQARLVSRFTQGLSVCISRPEFDTSRAILRQRIEGKEEELQISDEVIDYLASAFSNDVRNLEGSLNKLIFNATLYNPEVIDLQFARQVLAAEPVVDKQKELDIRKIKKAVIRFYGLSYSDLEGKSRQKLIVNARHIAVWLSRELLHLSYAQIGTALGGRDHKTVASSYERARTLMKQDGAFQTAVEKIRDSLL